MPTRLSIYNDALLICRERKISSVTQEKASRRHLDSAWDAGLIQGLLEEYDWICFRKTVMLDYDVNAAATEFGHRYTFTMPDDLARISGVYADEMLHSPHMGYQLEGNLMFSSIQKIYLEYVKNEEAVVPEISGWKNYFARYAAARLAYDACPTITSAADVDRIAKEMSARKAEAQSQDAMSGPTKRLPTGNWVQARGNYGRRNRRSLGRP